MSSPPPCSPDTGKAEILAVLQDLGLSPQVSDVEHVQHVCAAVCTRAAQLCAAALAAVLSHLQRSREQQTLHAAVATGGRMLEKHPRYCENRILCEQVACVCMCVRVYVYDMYPEGVLISCVQAGEYQWQSES